MTDATIVIPTIGRPSLYELLEGLERARGPRCRELIVVDDRRSGAPLQLGAQCNGMTVRVLPSGGRGPAAARNVGWRAATTDWIAFLDDDVQVDSAWFEDLADDLQAAAQAGASQAVIDVPLPTHRRPTDWERNVAGLVSSAWITADLAYRRAALASVGGFDERFRRAYREDSDLAIRVQRAGFSIVNGTRRTHHPVRPAKRTVSIGLQRGNADDVLMRSLHGRRWRALARAQRGRMPSHLLNVAAAAIAAGAALAGKRPLAAAAAAAWLASTAEFAYRRIAPGPRDLPEIAAMGATSVVIPFAAVYHKLRAFATIRRLLREAA